MQRGERLPHSEGTQHALHPGRAGPTARQHVYHNRSDASLHAMQPNGAEAGPADRGEQGQRLLSNYDAGGSTADAWGIAQLSEGAADTSTTAAAAPPPPAPPPARWRAPLAAFWNNGVAVAVVSSLSCATAAALVKSPLIQVGRFGS